jgi:hypothetical protein
MSSPTEILPRLAGGIGIALVLSLIGCTRSTADRQSSEISATATATASPSGEVVVRESTVEERQAAQDLHEEIARIDDAYPRPTVPSRDSPLHRVSRIEPDARITLENGMRVKMDGVSCSREGTEYLSRMLTRDGVHITFRETRSSDAELIPAEVWLVESSSEELPPAYSLIAETALTSGWCQPDGTALPDTNERFTRLAALGTRMRAARAQR